MHIGLLADLHANREAVEACMSALEARGCRYWVFLGDLIGYGADPGWVVERVRACVADGSAAVLGNHDQAVFSPPSQDMNPVAQAAIAWTREQLDASQIAFLRSLPLRVEHDDRLYVHANPRAPERWGYISSCLAAARSLAASPYWLTFCGHAHEPALYYAQRGSAVRFAPRDGVAIPLSTHRRWLAIPGSCGQPRDGDPAAACAWLDTDRRQLTFLRVPYDHDLAASRILAAGLPPTLAWRLEAGI